MTTPAIECRALTRQLRSGDRMLAVLDGIDVAIAPGELVAVVGPSGSGKSTLLALLAGLDRPTSGEVLVEGRPLSTLDEDGLAKLRLERIGFVFQAFELLPNLTALDNIRLPLELAGLGGDRARASELLERVGLAERSHHYPSQLSGGEQQRVALARAFATSPTILLADEPTGNLDAETGERVLALLEELHEHEGTTLVLVTHDPRIAGRATRRLHLRAGRIEREEREAPAA